MPPVISLCIICSDAHLEVLPRMLQSFLSRSNGKPAVDEVVIDFNGRDQRGLADSRIGPMLSGAGVAFFITPTAWTGDFSAARQANFERATGEWRMYADCDDILLGPSRAVEESNRAAGGRGNLATPTLQDFLRGLPPHINQVNAPYHYHLGSSGEPLIIIDRPRIVRWDRFWAWQGKVHEILVHALGRQQVVQAPGLVLQHRPVLAGKVRNERNLALTKVMAEERDPAQLPHEVLYGLAAEQRDLGNPLKSAELFELAASRTPEPQTQVMYWGWAVRGRLAAGQTQAAALLALRCVGVAPDRAEGYLLAAEVAAAQDKPEAVIRWYEASLEKPSPVGAMTEDRLARVLQPAYLVGPAYLRQEQFRKAAGVARGALELEPADPFCRRLLAVAQEGLDKQAIQLEARNLLDSLLEQGFIGLASRLSQDLLPVLPEDPRFQSRLLELQAKEPTALPADSRVVQWMARAPAEAVKLLAPVDSWAGGLQAVLRQAFEHQPAGAEVLLCATDTEDLSPWARVARQDAVTAPRLLKALDQHGAVQELQLVQEPDGKRFVRAWVKVDPDSQERCWRPDFTFWCPIYAEPWGPWRTRKWGTGGSEESVIYLAAELARRGHKVQVYAPLDPEVHRGVHVEGGVRWRPLQSLDLTREVPGTVIAHRAPTACRIPAFEVERLLTWHQDATYLPWNWTPVLAGAVRNLWVSEWQRLALAEPLGLDAEEAAALPGLVLGNGIPYSCFGTPAARDPLACVYISSPVRGLELLLKTWPQILAAEPGATLHVYYGWETSQGHPDHLEFKQKILALAEACGPSVIWRGRLPQEELEQDLLTKGVWLYPCTFIEGFCNAGVRATAAGLVPVYHRLAALPEVQYPSPFAYGPGVKGAFLPAALAALKASKEGTYNRGDGQRWAMKWIWEKTCDRLLTYLDTCEKES